jgi:hypothetical protein
LVGGQLDGGVFAPEADVLLAVALFAGFAFGAVLLQFAAEFFRAFLRFFEFAVLAVGGGAGAVCPGAA